MDTGENGDNSTIDKYCQIIKCILSPISKSTASATLTLNDSLCTCILNGPSELRPQQDSTNQLQIEVQYQSRQGSTSTTHLDKLIEHWLETIVKSTIIVERYPRSQIQLHLYEEQNLSGEATLLACICNTLCLTMLDANLPMKYAFAGVPIVRHPIKGLILLPTTKEELQSKTYFVLVFDTTLTDVLAMHASGTFDIKHLNDAIDLGKPIAQKLFQFYRNELEKRLTTT